MIVVREGEMGVVSKCAAGAASATYARGSLSSGVETAWEQVFPFTDDFEAVVYGDVKCAALADLVCALETVVGQLSSQLSCGHKGVAHTFMYVMTALARLSLVQSYSAEIDDVDVDRAVLMTCLHEDWQAIVDRDCLREAVLDDAFRGVLDEMFMEMWQLSCAAQMLTMKEAVEKHGSFMSCVRVVPVSGVLVVSGKGKPLHMLTTEEYAYPVLSLPMYRLILHAAMAARPSVCSDDYLLTDDIGGAAVSEFGIPLSAARVADWVWCVLAWTKEDSGYCYQKLLHPGARRNACRVLGREPLVSELLWYLENDVRGWACEEAVVSYGAALHVQTVGSPDIARLMVYTDRTIGKPDEDEKPDEVVDYYARALVDDFIKKHKPLPDPVAELIPVDVDLQTIASAGSGGVGREFVDVARVLYTSVDDELSPRAANETWEKGGGVSRHHDDYFMERELEITRDLYDRVVDGAVIREGYFQRTYRRFRRRHRRPRLENSRGNCFHVFDGFEAGGGSGSGPWERDKRWCVPGWQSYVAEFAPRESVHVAFLASVDCMDVRMDCTGEGAIDLGDVKLPVSGTVLWFSKSIRLHVIAGNEPVILRVSLPDVLSAVAVGNEIRQYMRIPGYAVVARSFSVVSGAADLTIPIERVRRSSVAGCTVYSGRARVDTGLHRFRFGGVRAHSAARVVVKSDPPDRLEYVYVCGARLRPRTRDTVSFITDLRNTDMRLSVYGATVVMVSLVQIVDRHEFQIAVDALHAGRGGVAVVDTEPAEV